jgi:hypothetical protein
MSVAHFEQDGILHIVYSGTVIPQEVEDLIPILERVEAKTERVPNRLVDLTRVTRLDIAFNDVLALANRRRALRFRNPFKIAAVTYDPVTTGFAEMYQALNDNPQTTIQVFLDRDTALRWLTES